MPGTGSSHTNLDVVYNLQLTTVLLIFVVISRIGKDSVCAVCWIWYAIAIAMIFVSSLIFQVFSLMWIMSKLPDVVFVLGGPGAGKGTQCQFIVQVSCRSVLYVHFGLFKFCMDWKFVWTVLEQWQRIDGFAWHCNTGDRYELYLCRELLCARIALAVMIWENCVPLSSPALVNFWKILDVLWIEKYQ